MLTILTTHTDGAGAGVMAFCPNYIPCFQTGAYAQRCPRDNINFQQTGYWYFLVLQTEGHHKKYFLILLWLSVLTTLLASKLGADAQSCHRDNPKLILIITF